MTTQNSTQRGGLRDLIASLREQNPEIAETEAALGVRLIVARNVLRLRVRAGMSQRELAERARMAQPRIAEIEAANVNFGVDTLDRLASGFCVPVDTLVKPTGTVTRPIPAASPMPQRTTRDGGVAWSGPKLVRTSSAAMAVAYDEQGNGY